LDVEGEGRLSAMADREIGSITNYFSKIGVAVIELSAPLKLGDEIRIAGGEREFQQSVESMQIEHQNIEEAEAGQEIALKLAQKARPGDKVFAVE
jgi:translation elongation factor EF-1alpha